MPFNLKQLAIGDYVEVQIVNKKGDRNLDGGILSGHIEEILPAHKMARLKSGWCVHTKDRLLVHDPKKRRDDG